MSKMNDRKLIEEAVEKFLSNGGKIQVIPEAKRLDYSKYNRRGTGMSPVEMRMMREGIIVKSKNNDVAA